MYSAVSLESVTRLCVCSTNEVEAEKTLAVDRVWKALTRKRHHHSNELILIFLSSAAQRKLSSFAYECRDNTPLQLQTEAGRPTAKIGVRSCANAHYSLHSKQRERVEKNAKKEMRFEFESSA